MTDKPVTNVAAPVRRRLLNLSRARGAGSTLIEGHRP